MVKQKIQTRSATKRSQKTARKQKRKPKALVHLDFLTLLGKTKDRKRRTQLINFANKSEIESVLEVIDNLLHGSLNLSHQQKQKMARYKTFMRGLFLRGLPSAEKKRKLSQSGGFLPALIPIAAGLLTKFLGPKIFGR